MLPRSNASRPASVPEASKLLSEYHSRKREPYSRKSETSEGAGGFNP
jgi:hypothetical protein